MSLQSVDRGLLARDHVAEGLLRFVHEGKARLQLLQTPQQGWYVLSAHRRRPVIGRRCAGITSIATAAIRPGATSARGLTAAGGAR